MPYSDPKAQRSYAAQWVWERRQRWLKHKTCADCGARERLKVIGILGRSPWSRREVVREKILADCTVICPECWTERSRHIVHGTLTAYKAYDCRCTECRQANSDRVAKQRTVTPRKRKALASRRAEPIQEVAMRLIAEHREAFDYLAAESDAPTKHPVVRV